MPINKVIFSDFNIKNSVNTNGGFYIARYEAGATTTRKTGNIKATVEMKIIINCYMVLFWHWVLLLLQV